MTAKAGLNSYIRNREYGGSRIAGSQARQHLFSSFHKVRSVDSCMRGIFNFDFSTDGSILGAACEDESLILLDPLNGNVIACRTQAHNDCVNCIRFLDTRTFVTCSDDTTVCLWDARHMKHKVRTLTGHSYWVKNIEYDQSSGLLVTAGFDGCIYTWDINRHTEEDVISQKVYSDSNLMRARLSPDASKLIISTTTGYLLVIHDLDLTTLSEDIAGFEPSVYSLMASRSVSTASYQQLFDRKRNRVEVIFDFPTGDDAMMIASLEVHPQGWCVASRNTTAHKTLNTEWTCVHDIQDVQSLSLLEEPGSTSTDDTFTTPALHDEETETPPNVNCPPTPIKRRRLSTQPHPVECDSMRIVLQSSISGVTSQPWSAYALSWGQQENSVSTSSRQLTSGDGDVEDDDESTEEEASRDGYSPGDSSSSDSSSDGEAGPMNGSLTRLMPRYKLSNITSMPKVDSRSEMGKTRRLTHFIEEPNVGRGFIKELSFSPDGRLLASPFSYGIRLLSFEKECRELCDQAADRPAFPVELYEVGTCMSHTREVTAVKFSPVHSLLVSGCLNGIINFHQPVL